MRLRDFFGLLTTLVLSFIVANQTLADDAAVTTNVTPHQLVQQVTDELLVEIAVYRGALAGIATGASDEQVTRDFFQQLTNTLEPVIDFNWISLNVMGSYRKTATREQRKRFRETFSQGLVETYGRGLLTYSDQQIKVLPSEGDISHKRRVTVVQEIQGADKTYPLLYSMGLNRRGEWKVVNVIINGINLGGTFRNQFAQSAEKYEGNMDKVIEHWATKKS